MGTRTFIETDGAGRSITPISVRMPQVELAVVGGSTIFGVGSSSNHATVPSILEQLINESGIRAEVYNLAVRGYRSFQEILAVHRFFLEKHVNMVVVISGVNDSWWSFQEPERDYALLPRSSFETAAVIRRIERGEAFILGRALFVDKARAYSATIDLMHRVYTRVIGNGASDSRERAIKTPPGGGFGGGAEAGPTREEPLQHDEKGRGRQ